MTNVFASPAIIFFKHPFRSHHPPQRCPIGHPPVDGMSKLACSSVGLAASSTCLPVYLRCIHICFVPHFLARCIPTSTFPLQLRLNYKRRSVEGLSPGMFTMAIMGNLTYGTSLLLRPLSMVYFVSRLPWLVPFPPHPHPHSLIFRIWFFRPRHAPQVGSLCVCFFDMCILAQFFKYGDAKSLPT